MEDDTTDSYRVLFDLTCVLIFSRYQLNAYK